MQETVRKFHSRQLLFEETPIPCVSVCGRAGDGVEYAVAELTKYFKEMRVPMAKDGYPVFVCTDARQARDGYRLQVTKEAVLIEGGNVRGAVYGAYRFLEVCFGVRFFTSTLEGCPAGDAVLKPLDITYAPRFERRSFDWYDARRSPVWMVKSGINDCGHTGPFAKEMGGSWNGGGISVHSLGRLTETGNFASPTPCLCDPLVLQTVKDHVRAALAGDPGIDSIWVSQNDTPVHCTCENCRRIAEEEGSYAGVLLRFVNAVAEDVAADYPAVIIDTLAYQWTLEPPRITRPRSNVAVWLCPIGCDFTHPLSDGLCPENAAFDRVLKGWAAICDRLQIWDYTNNFRFSIPTYANLWVLRDNMRYYADNHVRGMFPEGNYYSPSGEFGELRAYLLAKLMRDPYMSRSAYLTHMNEFLAAYYGPGWIYIRLYIDAVCGQAATGCQSIFGRPFEAVPEAFYRTMEDTFEAWWQAAERQAGDRRAFVARSRLQWRYIRLMLHPDAAVAAALVADVGQAGVFWSEGKGTALPAGADLAKSPDEWFSFDWWI